MRLTRSLIVVAMSALAILPGAHAQERFVPRLTVTGEASVAVAPDYAQIRTGITTQAKTAREASDANSRAASALMAALRASGVDDKDIQTTRLALQPTYDQSQGTARGRINGFQAANQVTIKVRDITKLADVIDKAIGAGATDIGGIEFLVSEPSKALDRARGEAFADARRKAEIYAKTAGITLGRVIALSEDHAAQEPIPMVMRQAAAPPPISPGEKTLRVTVTVSYELPN
jgi:uncharacterized protein